MRFFSSLFLGLLLSAAVFGAEYDLKLGVGAQGERTAYKGYSLQWSAAPVIDFDTDYIYIKDYSIGGKFINIKDSENKPLFMASIFASYDNFKFDTDRTRERRLKRLSNRHASVFAGVKLEALTPIGLFEAWAAGDVLGHSDGFYGRASYYVMFELGPVQIFPNIGIDWGDRRYNKYYYGISHKESQRSGLSAYRPSAAVAPYAGVAARIPFAERWEIAGSFEVSRVPRTIRNSPMTDRRYTCVFNAMLGFNF